MNWLILLIILALFLGPLRRPFFSNWRYTIPLIIGALAGFVLSALFVSFGGPPLMMLFGPVIGIFIIAPALKDGFDNFFKK